MIWFDYIALTILAYFIIRGFLGGFIRLVFSFIGMVVAFLYSGWLSMKISPYIGNLTTHNSKVLPIISFIIAFIIIYLSFIIFGFIIRLILGSMQLTIADYILGAILGFIKGALFITFFYLILVMANPASQKYLNKALTYPIIKNTWQISSQFLPNTWKNFLKSRHVKI